MRRHRTALVEKDYPLSRDMSSPLGGIGQSVAAGSFYAKLESGIKEILRSG